MAAGSIEKLIEALPKIIEDICHRVYMGTGPDVPFDLTFWVWYQKKKDNPNRKSSYQNKTFIK